jgi:lysozyme family protein
MTQSILLAPFILQAEGGIVNNKSDLGGLTNKGITWNTWQAYFGNTKDRFLAMQPADWNKIFKVEYWDKCLADSINSQRIANTIVDWAYSSGIHFPEKDTQEVINHIFQTHIAEDGCFGPATIQTLNSVDEPSLYDALIARRRLFYTNIVEEAHERNDYSQDKFLEGWMNRINNLVAYNLKFAA